MVASTLSYVAADVALQRFTIETKEKCYLHRCVESERGFVLLSFVVVIQNSKKTWSFILRSTAYNSSTPLAQHSLSSKIMNSSVSKLLYILEYFLGSIFAGINDHIDWVIESWKCQFQGFEAGCRLSKRRMESCSKCGAIISIYIKNAMELHKTSRSCDLIQCTICHVKYPLLMRIEHGTKHVRESRNIDTAWSHSDVFVVPEFVIEKDYEELYVRHKKQISPSRSVRTLTAVYNFQMNRL